jgi:uncharacterized protein (DUF2147 family)
MKRIVVLTALVIMSSIAVLAQNRANDIIGVWETENKDARMEIFKCGDKYCGKLLWGKGIVEEDGVTSKKDVNNPDPKLRSRDVVGITYLSGLTYDDDEYEDGKVYNSDDGKTYKCYVWLKKGSLYLRGYLGMPVLGQTTKWNSVK